jgi:hypothetical protein
MSLLSRGRIVFFEIKATRKRKLERLRDAKILGLAKAGSEGGSFRFSSAQLQKLAASF